MKLDDWNNQAEEEIDLLGDDEATNWDTQTGVHLLQQIEKQSPWQVAADYLKGLPLFAQIFLTLAVGVLLLAIAYQRITTK